MTMLAAALLAFGLKAGAAENGDVAATVNGVAFEGFVGEPVVIYGGRFNRHANGGLAPAQRFQIRQSTLQEEGGYLVFSNWVGGGSKERPYEISDLEHLRKLDSEGFVDKCFSMTKDLEIGIWSGFKSFSGTLDGNNKTIKGVNFSTTGST